MRNKILIFVGMILLPTSVLFAQSNPTTVNGGTAISGSGTVEPGVIYPAPIPINPVPPLVDYGFIQMNNLVVESVSSESRPAEILADFGYYPMPLMMNGGVPQSGAGVSTPETLPVSAQCYRFSDENASLGSKVQCPEPSFSATSSSAPGVSNVLPPNEFPYRNFYRIEVALDTRLLLRDRLPGALSDFVKGDQINVFGFQNKDGSLQAFIVRNLSKPEEKTFVQLENVELVSLPSASAPADLVVVQREANPCYDYGASGAMKMPFPCPLGVPSLSDNPAIQNLEASPSLRPTWDILRKYVVKIDAATILLDRTRNRLPLSSFKIGDKLNVYGEMGGGSGVLYADIVRDLSNPPATTVTNLNGTVTQINSDGSFILHTEDGREVTVQGAIQVGATVKLSGVLDELQNLLYRISEIYVKNGVVSQPPPPVLPPTTYCAQDAKLCPDGSYVARVAPSCEFAACPGASSIR